MVLAVAIVGILAIIWIATYFLLRDELRAVHPDAADDVLEIVNDAFKIAFIAIALAAIVTGLVLGARAQKRVNRISATLAKVAAGDFTARIEPSHNGDDLDYVGDRIDATLDELQRVMQRMRDLSANIAHDLRTPIARLRADLEDAAVEAEQGTDNASAIGAALEKTDQLVDVIDAIMRIAHVESGARRSAFASVDLGALTRKVSETFEPVVEDSGHRFELVTDRPANVTGDWDLLVQLLANLIHNAIRHTPRGSLVQLSAIGAHLSVRDDGPGVPESERARILEPMYRLDRSRNTPGWGLGLALVAAVAELHEAAITLTDNPDGAGLSVTVIFPDQTTLRNVDVS